MKTHSTLRSLAIKAIMLALLWIPGTLFAQGLRYISPNGNDITGNGSYEMPFKTLQKALDSCNNNTSWNIKLLDGIYDFDTITIFLPLKNIISISAENPFGATIKNTKLIFDFSQSNQYSTLSDLVIDSSSIEFSGEGTVYISDNHFKNSTYILAKNNTITADVLNSIFENSGMELNSLSATIINNTFVRSLSVTGSYAIYVPQAVNISIEGNIIQNYDYAIAGNAQNVKYNCFYNNVTNYPSGLDSTNIFKDPMLNSDFSLKPSSPCIGAYIGSDIGAIINVAPLCNFDFTYINNYGANYTFTPQTTNCANISSYNWDIKDKNNITIKTSTDNILTYTMPGIGDYVITLEGTDINGKTHTYIQYLIVDNTCPANGSMNIISADEITGLVKFKITAINTDSVFFSFGDLKDSVFKYSGTEMTFTHKYPTNWKYGNEFSPYYSLYNTLENCSIPKYSDMPVSIKNKNCRITTWAYSDTLTLSVNAEKYGNEDVLVTLKNSKGTLDNFTLNTSTYFYEKQFAYAQAGYDTLYVYSKGSYCESTDTVPIYVWGNPCPSTYTERKFIDSTTYKITVKGAKSGYTYYWYFSSNSMDTSFTTTDSAIVMKVPMNDYIFYEVTGYSTKNDCNTGWMYEYFVTGSLNCYASFSYDQDTAARKLNFYNYSPEGKKYKWNFGDGTTSALFEPSHTYVKDGIYNVTLTVLDEASSCVQSFSKSITIGTVSCKADFTSAISGMDATFTNISTGAQEVYWDFGDYGYSTERNPKHTYTEAGIYNVYLYIWNSSQTNSCWDEIYKTIKVGDVKDIITSEFDYYTTDDSVYYFSDISKGSPTSWYWQFGDGTVSTKSYVKKTFKYPDIYNVCLTVKNADNSISTSCQDIWVGGYECTANAEFGYRLNGKQVTFTDKSTGSFDKYYWDFGDGTTSAEKNPVYTFEKEGFYYVTLTVKKANSECASTFGEFILIGQSRCRADFSYSVDPAKLSADLKFNGKSGESSLYYWAFDDGDYSDKASLTKTFDYPGLHYVMLAIYDGTSMCMDYIEKEIQVGEVQCSAGFTYYVDAATNKAWCSNTSKGDSLYYFWEFGDGKYSTDKNPSHTFKNAGYYTIGLTVFNDNWCMDHFETVVTISGKGVDCEADFAAMVNNATRTVTFSDKSKGDITDYYWNFGNYPQYGSSESNSPSYTYPKVGQYNVCLVVWNNEGKSNMTCKTIKVGSDDAINCQAKFKYSVDSVNQKVYLFNKSIGNTSNLIWNLGDGKTITSTKDTSYTYKDAGYYFVSLEINTKEGCSSAAYDVINVSMKDTMLCRFGYNIDESKQKAGGYPVDFIGAGLGDQAKLKWDYGDGTTDTTSTSPTHEYKTADTTYNVCYTIIDPITSDSSTYCEPVEVKKTGVKTITDNSGYTVYPNPAKDNITAILYIKQATNAKVDICDLSGRTIMNLNSKLRLETGTNSIKFDINSLQYGSYVLRFTTSSGDIYKKLIIKQ